MAEWWRRRGRIGLDEAARYFDYFRIVRPEEDRNPQPVIYAEPRVPESPMKGEDKTIPRVSLAPSIWACIIGVAGGVTVEDLQTDSANREDWGGRVHEWHVYGCRGRPPGFVPNEKIQKHVPDAEMTGEVWATARTRLHFIGIIGGDFSPDGEYDLWIVEPQ